MEAAHRVVLTCPMHGCGLHWTRAKTGPAWCCSEGKHVVGVLGLLSTLKGGKARLTGLFPLL